MTKKTAKQIAEEVLRKVGRVSDPFKPVKPPPVPQPKATNPVKPLPVKPATPPPPQNTAAALYKP